MKNLDKTGEVPAYDDLLIADENIIYDDLFVVVYEDEAGLSVVNFNSQAGLDSFSRPDDDYFLIIERSKLPDQKHQAAWEFTGERSGIIVNQEKLKAILVSDAERMREHKLSLVRADIDGLQSDLILDIITDADREKLVSVKKYIIELKKLDLSTAPDIEWPVAPE
ncbi:tail fiber assembly protein [Yersinia enterocolitica]|uniref:tail fiber assembly protein n=1 Tax=Yersinia enterocolitica TaxID=630 RepID=UPI003CFFF8CC|nr:tail fiber assembly protein [Yersinia enterocolitica]